MYYDITNPNASYSWLYETLKVREGELIGDYIIECHSDPNEFYKDIEQ